MHRLRNRLIAAFLAATIPPLGATIWVATSLLDRSLGYATTGELDRLSHTLETTVRQFYQSERDALKREAGAGTVAPTTYSAITRAGWPEPVRAFWESGDAERFVLTGSGGDHVDYLQRDGTGVRAYRRNLGGVQNGRNLPPSCARRASSWDRLRGATSSGDSRSPCCCSSAWSGSSRWRRSSSLPSGSAGRCRSSQRALPTLRPATGRGASAHGADDEVGQAVEAFNHMAEQLRQSRERLVHLTQMASWQSLARKTAHELKNSLTPIRLTVEEMVARRPADTDRAFLEQAAQIVVSEIDTLERRVRAFSDFAGEPHVRPEVLDVNALVLERVALLRPAHPESTYNLRLDDRRPHARADADLTKGILTNLLQNAAEAAGAAGTLLVATSLDDGAVVIEVHDSGPGLNPDAAATLFEPTITFKKHGMGLGLSIAKKNALLSGGDVTLVAGALGGAAFRVTLPRVEDMP